MDENSDEYCDLGVHSSWVISWGQTRTEQLLIADLAERLVMAVLRVVVQKTPTQSCDFIHHP